MKRANWPLHAGLLLLAPIMLIVLFGQNMALRSPVEFNFLAEIGGVYAKPPFAAFRSAEFPLGSDPFGRDTLSRLLWALRPTLVLALTVALLRLTIGSLLGVAAGWSAGAAGRWLDALTRAALSVPVLIVALMCIAALQTRFGASAFVLGLVFTGWAETAQFCADQTRIIKHEMFIEAARALGAPGWQIALKHVLRQLLPMLRLFFVLETGSALLGVAALGFLGYFSGGANWIMVTDFEAQRLAGAPELSEMLASAVQARDSAQMLIVGAAVVLVVLCVNLLGEGARRQLALERRKRSAAERVVGDFVQSRQDRLAEALAQRQSRRRLAFVALLAALGLGAAVAVQALTGKGEQPAVAIAGGHLWTGERRDGPGSMRGNAQMPDTTAPRMVWQTQLEGNVSGGPAVAVDGTIYIATSARKLYAIGADGRVRWTAALSADPVGAPGLTQSGAVLVADVNGGLSRVEPDGALAWRVSPVDGLRAISGPVLDDAGNVYLACDGTLLSLDAGGQLRWRAQLPYAFFSPVPRVGGGFVFFKDLVLSAASGTTLLKASRDDVDQWITGSDGRMYLMSQSSLLAWQSDGATASLARVAQLDWTREYPGRVPSDATVWSDGGIWLVLGGRFNDTRLIWLSPAGAVQSSVALPFESARLLAIGSRGELYVCGERTVARLRCDALRPGAGSSQWTFEFDVAPLGGAFREQTMVAGGALAGDRLIVAGLTGKVIALGAP